MMNNVNYPTDFHILVETDDVEEGYNSAALLEVEEVDNISTVDGSYCNRIKNFVDNIEGQVATFNSTEYSCQYVDVCRTLCWNLVGDDETRAVDLEYSCSFADFGNDNYIDQNDVEKCDNFVTENGQGPVCVGYFGGGSAYCNLFDNQDDCEQNQCVWESEGYLVPLKELYFVGGEARCDVTKNPPMCFGGTNHNMACESQEGFVYYMIFIESLFNFYSRDVLSQNVSIEECNTYFETNYLTTTAQASDAKRLCNILSNLSTAESVDYITPIDYGIASDLHGTGVPLGGDIDTCEETPSDCNGIYLSSLEPCPNYPNPMFIDYDSREKFKNEVLGSGFYKNYIYGVPLEDQVGKSLIRVAAMDKGINENGKFTLDEQAEYIRVYNHRNGKYYKLVMEELDE